MNKQPIYSAIQGALVADAYALASHWIYDEHQLSTLPIDWNTLNTPQALWHKGKVEGDFTHYGDHMLWLYDYIVQNHSFTTQGYKEYWLHKMETYTGYIDGSSRDTVSIMRQNPSLLQGAGSHDLSIIGRIAPLLLVSSSKEEFLKHVDNFVSFTHNSPLVKDAAQFFGSVLFEVANCTAITDAMAMSTCSDSLVQRYRNGLASKGKESFNVIRTFGPACSIEGGFEGVIHLLVSYTDYKEAMIANAKAGGDNAARGMIVGMLLGAQGCEIPLEWKTALKHLPSF